ncbi:hypothetical protein [Spongorhabdus nitratireducens]
MTKIAFIIISSLLITSCASLTGVDPSSLKKTTKTNRVEIEEDFKWEEHFALGNVHFLTLKSGVYNAYLDDKRGTYYEGSDMCLEWIQTYDVADPSDPSAITRNLRCGIYVPNNDSKQVKVYYYINIEESKKVIGEHNPGIIIRALDKAEWDNLKHLMYQPDNNKLKAIISVVD